MFRGLTIPSADPNWWFQGWVTLFLKGPSYLFVGWFPLIHLRSSSEVEAELYAFQGVNLWGGRLSARGQIHFSGGLSTIFRIKWRGWITDLRKAEFPFLSGWTYVSIAKCTKAFEGEIVNGFSARRITSYLSIVHEWTGGILALWGKNTCFNLCWSLICLSVDFLALYIHLQLSHLLLFTGILNLSPPFIAEVYVLEMGMHLNLIWSGYQHFSNIPLLHVYHCSWPYAKL